MSAAQPIKTSPSAELDVALPRPIPAWRRIVRRPQTIVGAAWLLIVIVASVFAPWLAPYSPLEQNLSNAGATPTIAHLLGTDFVGRDVLTQLMYGGSDALLGMVVCVLVAALIGVTLGVVAGYAGGPFDSVGSILSNALQTMPGVVVMLMAVSIFGTAVVVGMVVLGILLSSFFFRLARNSARAIRRELYVDASKVAGLRGMTIVTRHVLPNVSGPLIVQASLTATVALLLQAGLSFLGQGPPPPAAEWGAMVKQATDTMTRYPWLLIPTGGCIAFTAIALNLIGDSVADEATRTSVAAATVLTPRAQATRSKSSESASAPVEGSVADGHLLEVSGLSVSFAAEKGRVTVLDNVSFSVDSGETVALVGESGCGKSVTSLAVIGLLPGSGRIDAGTIRFQGHDLVNDPEALDKLRGVEIGYVSQEPIAALDPSFTIGSQIAEPLRCHEKLSRPEARKRCLALLRMVEIQRPEEVAKSYAHELSGGMAQRVAIAIALSGRPNLLIADEPTTALDVTIQAEILQLLRDLQAQTGIGLLLVTHDWGVVADIADRAVVMYAGQVVEESPLAPLTARPMHPYTRSLLRSIPSMEEAGSQLPTIRGSVPPPKAWPASCRFANRCDLATDQCRVGSIPLVTVDKGRTSRCIRTAELTGESR